jgi:hypothetical protein
LKKTAVTILALLAFQMPAPAEAATGRCPQWEKHFKRYGLPAKTFSKIAFRESRCNPKSVSAVRKSTGYPDVGLVQIQGSWRTVTYQVCKLKSSQSHIKALTTVDCNLRVARYLYDNGGLGHWKGSSK